MAGTLYAITEITRDNLAFAEKVTVPVHVSVGKNDKLTTPSSIKKFTDRMTACPNKMILRYEGEHHLVVDGWVIEEILKQQVEWL